MKTPWHRKAFRITSPLWGESTGNRRFIITVMQSFDIFIKVWWICKTNSSVTGDLSVMWRHCNVLERKPHCCSADWGHFSVLLFLGTLFVIREVVSYTHKMSPYYCKVSLFNNFYRMVPNARHYNIYICRNLTPRRRHQMETFSAWLSLWAGNSPVTGEISTQRPETRSFDVFFDLRLNNLVCCADRNTLHVCTVYIRIYIYIYTIYHVTYTLRLIFFFTDL